MAKAQRKFRGVTAYGNQPQKMDHTADGKARFVGRRYFTASTS